MFTRRSLFCLSLAPAGLGASVPAVRAFSKPSQERKDYDRDRALFLGAVVAFRCEFQKHMDPSHALEKFADCLSNSFNGDVDLNSLSVRIWFDMNDDCEKMSIQGVVRGRAHVLTDYRLF